MYHAFPLFLEYKEKRGTSHDKHHFWTAEGGPQDRILQLYLCCWQRIVPTHFSVPLFTVTLSTPGIKEHPAHYFEDITSSGFFEMICCSGTEIAVFSAEICLKIVSNLYIFSHQAFFVSRHGIFQRGWLEFSHSLSLKSSQKR